MNGKSLHPMYHYSTHPNPMHPLQQPQIPPGAHPSIQHHPQVTIPHVQHGVVQLPLQLHQPLVSHGVPQQPHIAHQQPGHQQIHQSHQSLQSPNQQPRPLPQLRPLTQQLISSQPLLPLQLQLQQPQNIYQSSPPYSLGHYPVPIHSQSSPPLSQRLTQGPIQSSEGPNSRGSFTSSQSLFLAKNNTNNSTISQIDDSKPFSMDETISILTLASPSSTAEYAEHIYKIADLIFVGKTEAPHDVLALQNKYFSLLDDLEKYINVEDPIHSKLYLVIERNFDIFIKISTNLQNVDVSTKTIRFLTKIIMNLNYWEIYNLLNWKPAIYHFLSVIHFDLNECYMNFIKEYSKFNFNKLTQPSILRKGRNKRKRALDAANNSRRKFSRKYRTYSDASSNDEDGSGSSTPFLETANEHDRFVSESLAGLTPKEKRKIRVDAKLAAHRIIKKSVTSKSSNKSSNYDPDVIHECQLTSADELHKMCLRRFSRKYELIRHQETVHSKKKKLFKCFVCVKQNPGIGPRIFTRHDTLAKHIRVNHKISGKEAKAEVAYSKKNAEVVEEGDITVHVGRRKTKVDFELRAHMEKKKSGRDDDMDDSGYLEMSDLDSGDEEVTFNN